jgi:non-ribosomal peptide synthetase component F
MDVTYATLPTRGMPLTLPSRPRVAGRLGARLAADRSPLATLARTARRTPDQPVASDADRLVTAAELHVRVRLLAGALHARGIGRGSTVGLMCREHSGYAQTALAVRWIGADLVLVDVDASPERLGHLGRAEGLHLLVHDADRRPTVVRSGLDVPTLVSDGHGSGSVAGACDFAHPAPPRHRRA